MKILKEELPNIRIVFVVNCDIKAEVVNGFKLAGDHFGVEVVELSGITKEFGHPNIKGMEEICNQVLKALS